LGAGEDSCPATGRARTAASRCLRRATRAFGAARRGPRAARGAGTAAAAGAAAALEMAASAGPFLAGPLGAKGTGHALPAEPTFFRPGMSVSVASHPSLAVRVRTVLHRGEANAGDTTARSRVPSLVDLRAAKGTGHALRATPTCTPLERRAFVAAPLSLQTPKTPLLARLLPLKISKWTLARASLPAASSLPTVSHPENYCRYTCNLNRCTSCAAGEAG
jgi:hypothetical protein